MEFRTKLDVPEGIATVVQAAVYPVKQMLRIDRSKTRPCPECSEPGKDRLVSQMKFQERLDSGKRLVLPGPGKGKPIDLSSFEVPDDPRVTGARVYLRTAAGGRWLDVFEPMEFPGRMEAIVEMLGATNADLRAKHALESPLHETASSGTEG